MARSVPKLQKEENDQMRKVATKTTLEGWTRDANSDQAEPLSGKPEPTQAPEESVRLTGYIEFRAHPDLKKRILAIAREQRRLPSELYREFMIKGLESAGYLL